jgi:peptidoglycan/xylan/chitin deacetylase (PgdA/CDA1 family)
LSWKRALLLAIVAPLLLALWVFGPLAFAAFGGDTPEKVVALSFDDGPYPPYTGLLLDVLAREGVRATFFLTGAHLDRNRGLGRRMVAEGHVLANHSWDASVLAFEGPAGIRGRIARTDAVLREIGWQGPIEFRAPRGQAGWLTALELWRAGRRHVLGVAVGDWLRPGLADGHCLYLGRFGCATQDPDTIEAQLLSAVRPGAILVVHDGYDGGPGADRSGSVEAVRRIIPRLRRDGYSFVTVPELLQP